METTEIRALAASLRRLADEMVVQRPGLRSAWWRGRGPYFDLFVDRDEHGALVWFELTLRGRDVRWARSHGRVRTGRTDELAVETSKTPSSRLVHADEALDREAVALFASLCREAGDADLVDVAQTLERALLPAR